MNALFHVDIDQRIHKVKKFAILRYLNFTNFFLFSITECRIEVDGIETAVCNSHIHVGFPPLKPENFTCISENWQNLNCTWDIPYNPVPTEYKLFYWEPGRRGR